MSKQYISLGVNRPKDKCPKGAYTAMVYVDNVTKQTKTAALHTNGDKECYETVDLWAQDKAKELGLEYRKVSKEELDERLFKAEVTPKATILGNKLYFKGEITRFLPILGAERILDVIDTAREFLLEAVEKEKALKVKEKSAKENLSRALYQTYVDTGIDASKFCNDPEVIAMFNELKLATD